MDLERLSLRLRPRSDWEAVDLGLRMVRTWLPPVYRAWLVVMVPLALVLVLGLGTKGWLLFWWLLPLGQMAVLRTLSRRVFGQPSPLRETLAALPGLWRRGLAELGLRRLHPARALRLAVGQLEGLSGAERRLRVAVLSSRGQEAPGGLPLIFMVFEFGLLLALIVLVFWMLPEGLGVDGELFTERFFSGASPPAVYRTFWLAVAVAVLMLDPLYVGVGFALYLNRRTQLEGWDLEIALRRLVSRLDPLPVAAPPAQVPEPQPAPPSADPSGPTSRSAVALTLLLITGVVLPGDASGQLGEALAEEGAPPSFDSEWRGDPELDPRQVITEVMQLPELDRTSTEVRWRLREGLFDREEKESQQRMDLSWLQGVGLVLAGIFEPLLWVLVAIGVLVLLAAIWKQWPDAAAERSERLLPERILGLDVKPDSLPDDVATAAERLWREGELTAALSLLYRGALVRLVQEGIALRESFTENDCLHLARQSLTRERFGFLAELTRAWQRLAYAHRPPGDEAARRLWSSWNRHFSSPRDDRDLQEAR